MAHLGLLHRPLQVERDDGYCETAQAKLFSANVTVDDPYARLNFLEQFLHYRRACHGAVTSQRTQRGHTAFVHAQLLRVIGACGIHTGTMSLGTILGRPTRS
jgi:ribulose 1,5-bisphosphate carboxylase large subunit-like protein